MRALCAWLWSVCEVTANQWQSTQQLQSWMLFQHVNINTDATTAHTKRRALHGLSRHHALENIEAVLAGGQRQLRASVNSSGQQLARVRVHAFNLN